MENNQTRSFEIEGTAFTLSRENGYTALRSGGSHWALRDTDGSWCVFKGEHFRTRLGCMEAERMASRLLAFDEAHRRMLAGSGIGMA